MTIESDVQRLTEIRRRLNENAYFVNPHADVNVKDDMTFLLALVERFEKKSSVLGQQVLELTQEIENVRSDFDSHR
jgi:hypothetical protein